MAVHHRISKREVDAELNRLLRGEINPPEDQPPVAPANRPKIKAPSYASNVPELIRTFSVAGLLALLLVGLTITLRFEIEARSLELLRRLGLGG